MSPRLAGLRDRRVLVTGDTGFKGSWLVALLEALGAEVAGFSLPPETCSLHSLLGRRPPPWGYGDVRKAQDVERPFRRHAPELVFHLAAQALVRRSYADPGETFTTNVQGTWNVLEQARRTPSVRAVLVVTSDKCYRNDGPGRAFREDDPLGGSDPYSASKAAAEIVAAAYYRSFFADSRPPVGVATARAGNVLGGGDGGQDRLLPDILRSIEAGRPVPLRYPNAVRPWQHVLDVCYGYGLLGQALLQNPHAVSRAWNFAPRENDRVMRVREIAEFVLSKFGASAGWRHAEETSAGMPEAAILRLDAERARRELGWDSLLSAHEAVEWTVDWHQRLAAGADAQQLCAHQIQTYLDLLTRTA